jgi:hypothetical protein
MSWSLVAAAALSLVTAAIHVFAGGPSVARPLLAAADLDPIAKYTNYYCWHMVTIVLAALPIGFAWAALGGPRELAIFTTALAAAFTAWSLALVLWKQQRALDLPQWLLFAPITLAGLVGVWP